MVVPTTNKALLSATQLTCIREERILFDELSFELHPGDIVQITGPNGAGKTSLLRIIAGLSRPYSGKVYYQQQAIESCREEYQTDLLYLGHLAGVKAELTAEENLTFNLKLNNNNKFNTTEILNFAGLEGFEHTLTGHLSAGQQRRTALGRLWHNQAKIWILDEPFTAIDKNGVILLERLFLKHIAEGGCIILTTHQDMTLINQQLKKIQLEYHLI